MVEFSSTGDQEDRRVRLSPACRRHYHRDQLEEAVYQSMGEEVLNGSELPPSHPLYKWGKDLFVRTSKFKGEFKKDDLLLSGTADRVSEEANGVDNPNFHPVTYTYHLVVRPNELVGVQQGRVSVSSMILKQVI